VTVIKDLRKANLRRAILRYHLTSVSLTLRAGRPGKAMRVMHHKSLLLSGNKTEMARKLRQSASN
jgi:hypothetical protein